MTLIDPAENWGQLSPTNRILYPIACLVILLLSGLCSGLTIGIFSIDVVDMRVLSNTGTATQRTRAGRLIPLLEKANLTLVTLLVANTLAMTSLPLVLDAMCGEFLALIISVTFLLFFGEVLPQATFVRHNVVVCSTLVPFVYFCFVVTFPLSYPLSLLLDYTVGSEDTSVTRDTFHDAVQRLYGMTNYGEDGLVLQEIKVMQGAMMLPSKSVSDLTFVKWSDTFMLNANELLTPELTDKILESGFSRIPVYLGSKQQIVGVLLVKALLSMAFSGPDVAKRVIDLPLREPLRIHLDGKLLDVYRAFRRGQSQLAAVYGVNGALEGFVSLEDIFTLIQQQEALDELDSDHEEVPSDSFRPSDATMRRSQKLAQQQRVVDVYESIVATRSSHHPR